MVENLPLAALAEGHGAKHAPECGVQVDKYNCIAVQIV